MTMNDSESDRGMRQVKLFGSIRMITPSQFHQIRMTHSQYNTTRALIIKLPQGNFTNLFPKGCKQKQFIVTGNRITLSHNAIDTQFILIFE